MQLIQVLYHRDRGGPVDDITLDELIRSQKITHFYRPSEDKWVDISVDPVRGSNRAGDTEGLKRRYADKEEDKDQRAPEGRSDGFCREVFRWLRRRPPRKAPSAEEWLERGLRALRATDPTRAARAFALSIRLNPQCQEAYLHRGLVYEALGNLRQAIEDYGTAVELDPKDGKIRNRRPFILERPGITVKAIAGLRRVADLQRPPTRPLGASRTSLREALITSAERPREGKLSDAGAERFREVRGDLHRLMEKYGKEITKLEAQVGEVMHKHAVLVEASRLLEEERAHPSRTLPCAAVCIAVLLACVSALWVHLRYFAESVVPAQVESASQKEVDRVKQSLLKLGAPPAKVEDLTMAIKGAAASAQVCPILLVALMYTENEGFDYKAVSEKGYKGLMQTPWASMRWADVDTLLGARILQEKLRLTGNNLVEALRLYKGGKNPTATRQAKRTMAVYEDLLKEEQTQ